MQLRVGVVGAGIAGLGAARALMDFGHESVVFESSAEVGGRVQTRTLGAYVFDTGATSVAPRGLSLESAILSRLDTTDLIRVSLPIYTQSSLRIGTGDPAKNRIERFTYRTGNQTLPRLLAAGLDIRLSDPVFAIERVKGGFSINGEEFDGVVLTPPVPRSRALLSAMGETRPLVNTSYRACLSVLLGFERVLAEPRYHALLDPEQRHPLTWLSLESVKCPGRAPDGSTAIVAQLSAQYSRMHFDAPEETIVAATLDYVERLYGREWSSPAVFGVVRWEHSLPETTALFESANQANARIIVAGDGVMGARVEFAFESGLAAARMLTEASS